MAGVSAPPAAGQARDDHPMRDAFGVERDTVSKIAMRPVYHGTSPAGATKLKRLISSHTPGTASFKTYDIPGDHRPAGLYTSTKRSIAENYSAAGKDGGLRGKGKVLVFNSVGVKPKYRSPMEEIYDPKDLGMPVATRSINRRTAGKKAVVARQRPKPSTGSL